MEIRRILPPSLSEGKRAETMPMNPSRAAGDHIKSFSTRLYRLTQQHKHWFFIVPALIVLLTVVIYPIIFATGVSLFRVTFASQSRPFVGLQNFERMLSNDDFLQSTYNTLFYVVFSVSGSLILGFGAALFLRRVTVGKDLMLLVIGLISALMFRFLYRDVEVG